MIRCDLPYPSGVSTNALWRHGRGRTYKIGAASKWQQTVGGLLLVAGLRRLPSDRIWTWSLKYTLYACKGGQDLDNTKLLIDTVALSLDVDDRYLTDLEAHLERVAHRGDQKLAVEVSWAEAGEKVA